MNDARVLHCAWSGGLGGTERHVEGVVTHAASLGRFDHAVLFLDGRGPIAEALEVRGVAYRLAFRRGWDLVQLVRFARLIRAVRPAIVHFHTRTLPAQLVARLALRSAAFVYTEHAPGALEGRWQFRLFYRLFGRRFHRVAAIAPAMRQCLLGFGVPESRIVDVPHGVERRRIRAREHHDEFVVGVVARLEPQKQIDLFVETVAAVRARGIDCRGLVVGGGSLADGLRRQIEGIGGTAWVELTGPQVDVFPHLARMDVFLMTSDVESFGITALEAMAAGVPVVAMPAVGGLIDIAREGGVMLGSRSVDEAASTVAELANDQPRRDQLAARGLRVVERHTYESVIERLEAAYAEACRERRPQTDAVATRGRA